MKRHLIALSVALFALPVLAAPGAHGPNGEHISAQDKSGGVIGRQADGSVILPMPNQALLGIHTQFVSTQTVQDSLTLAAIVRPHPEGYAVIQPSSDGRFEAGDNGILSSGAQVKAGQLLGYVRYLDTAYELASQNSELKVVRNQIAQTRRDVGRLESLGELVSKQELDQLQTQLKNLVEQEQSLQQGLEKPEALIAPIDGVLINNQVRNGQWVEAGTSVFEVVSPSLRQVDAVTARTDTLADVDHASIREYPQVTLDYQGYSPRLAGGLATLHFEYRSTEQSPLPLLLDQPVTVTVPLEDNIEGIVIPARALMRNRNNLPIVWIKVSAERFAPQMVQYQPIGAEEIVITQGLGADNRVVVDGASLLNQIR